MYEPKTDTELKSLAFDIVEDKVFYDQMINENDDIGRIMTGIFMPLFFMGKEDLQQLVDDGIEMFYEYYDKAVRRVSINGYPQFYSCHTLDKNDKVKLIAFINEVQEFKTKFKEEIPQDE